MDKDLKVKETEIIELESADLEDIAYLFERISDQLSTIEKISSSEELEERVTLH